MNIQVKYSLLTVSGTLNPNGHTFRKKIAATSHPAIELVITNEEYEDIFVSAIELEFKSLLIPFRYVSKTKPTNIKSESEFKEKVTLEKLIEDYNVTHHSNINSLIGAKIIVTDCFGDKFESEEIDY